MATPENIEEVSAASLALQAALARMGAATIAEALLIWQRLSAKDPQGTAQAWLDDAVEMVMSRRGQSRELALAYYRLTRALITGSTIPDPRDVEPRYVTVGHLRTTFAELAESALPDDDGRDGLHVPVEPSDAAVKPLDDAPGETVERDDTDADLLDMSEEELIEAIRDDIRQTENERDADDEAAEEELRIVLEQLGSKGLAKRIEGLDDEDDARRREAKSKSGYRQAAAAERVAINGGRGELSRLSQSDPRVIGYVRYSTTGSPCGWCAMLISRGLSLYSSEMTALTRARDGELFHDNCQCAALPVYSTEQYRADTNYDINRLYGEWWPEVTEGTGGKTAVALWRKFFRLTEDMPEHERLDYWEKWINSPEGRKWSRGLSDRLAA